MQCPLERQQHANSPERLEGNKGDIFSQASEKCGLLVVTLTDSLRIASPRFLLLYGYYS